jgi:hypothetical protein
MQAGKPLAHQAAGYIVTVAYSKMVLLSLPPKYQKES